MELSSGDSTHSTRSARLATRLAFFVAGFALACCAPLFPFLKENVGADEGQFGLLLLCLGLGSIVAMPVTGVMAARRGARPLILFGGFGLAAFLPFLALAQTPVALGTALLGFGASLGTLDVAVNVHGVEVEKRERRPLMSNFHAQFSIGGFFGAGLTTLLLSFSVPVVTAAFVGAVLSFVAMMFARPGLLRVSGGEPEPFAWPKGIVILLSALAAITFLVEGALLDWGALLLIERSLFAPENAGLGYILFSVAMVAGRLTGDHIVATYGGYKVLVIGGLLVIGGVSVIQTAPAGPLALLGFVLVGLGASNLVPVVFSAAGRQTVMPPGLAIASVTTTGYAGILMGPAIIGFVADTASLPAAFWLLALLMAAVPLAAHRVARV